MTFESSSCHNGLVLYQNFKTWSTNFVEKKGDTKATEPRNLFARKLDEIGNAYASSFYELAQGISDRGVKVRRVDTQETLFD